MIIRDGNTVVMPPILTTPVRIGAGPLVSPTRIVSQDIGSPSGYIGPQEVRYDQPLDTSIHGVYEKHRDPEPTWSKIIGHKLSEKSSADVYLLCPMNLARDAVLAESPNFIGLGLSYINTSDELGSVFIPATRILRPMYGFNCLPPGHIIGEVTEDRVIRTRSVQNYSSKTDFETRRENQYFGRQNNYMSRPPLDLTPRGTKTTNVRTSTIYSIPVRPKTPDPMPLTPPMDFPEQNGKLHVPGDPDPDPTLPDSSSKKYNLSDYRNSSKFIKNKSDKKKKRWKHKKQDASDSFSSDSDLSDDSYYRHKQSKKEEPSENRSDKIMRTFNGKVTDESV